VTMLESHTAEAVGPPLERGVMALAPERAAGGAPILRVVPWQAGLL
jgi:hypothetical protein